MLSCDLWSCPTCRGEGEVNIKDPYSKAGRSLCPSCEGARKVPAPWCDECGLRPSECMCVPTCDAMYDEYNEDYTECGAAATHAFLGDGCVWKLCVEHAPKIVGQYEPVAGMTLGQLRVESCRRAEATR
jgi:hypothetical protein